MQCLLDSDSGRIRNAVENEECSKDGHHCPGPDVVFVNSWVTELLKEYVGLEILRIQQGDRHAEREDKHDLTEENPLRNEKELGQGLQDEEDCGYNDAALKASMTTRH